MENGITRCTNDLLKAMFRAIIYNRLRVEIASENLATWQDAVQWLAKRPGNGRKWSEILTP